MIGEVSTDNKLMGYLEDNDFNRNLTIFLSRNIYRWLIDPDFTSELKKGQKDLTALQINEIADDLRDLITIGSLGKNFTEGLDKVSKKRFHKDFRRLQSRLKSDGAYNSTFLTYLQTLVNTVFRLVSGKYKISKLNGINQTITNYLLKDEACIEDNEFNRMVLLFLSRYVYCFIIHPMFKLDFKRKLLNPITPQLNRIAKWLRRKVIRRPFPYEWLKKLDDVRRKEFEKNYGKLRTRLRVDQIFSYEYLSNLRNLAQFVFNLVVGKFNVSKLEGFYREVTNYLGGLETFMYDEEFSYDFKWSFIIVICRIMYDSIVNQGYFSKSKAERERIRADLMENGSVGIKLNILDSEVKYKYFEEVNLVSRKEFAEYYKKLQFRLNLDQIYGMTFMDEVDYLTLVVFELIEGKLGRIPSTNFIRFIGEDLLRNWDANLKHKWIPKATLSREPISQLMLNEKIEEYNKNLIEQDTMKENKHDDFNEEKESITNSGKDNEFTEDNSSSFNESREIMEKNSVSGTELNSRNSNEITEFDKINTEVGKNTLTMKFGLGNIYNNYSKTNTTPISLAMKSVDILSFLPVNLDPTLKNFIDQNNFLTKLNDPDFARIWGRQTIGDIELIKDILYTRKEYSFKNFFNIFRNGLRVYLKYILNYNYLRAETTPNIDYFDGVKKEVSKLFNFFKNLPSPSLKKKHSKVIFTLSEILKAEIKKMFPFLDLDKLDKKILSSKPTISAQQQSHQTNDIIQEIEFKIENYINQELKITKLTKSSIQSKFNFYKTLNDWIGNNANLLNSSYYKKLHGIIEFSIKNIDALSEKSVDRYHITLLASIEKILINNLGKIIYNAFISRNNRDIFKNGFADYLIWLNGIKELDLIAKIKKNLDVPKSIRRALDEFKTLVLDNIVLDDGSIKLNKGSRLTKPSVNIWRRNRRYFSQANDLFIVLAGISENSASFDINSKNVKTILLDRQVDAILKEIEKLNTIPLKLDLLLRFCRTFSLRIGVIPQLEIQMDIVNKLDNFKKYDGNVVKSNKIDDLFSYIVSLQNYISNINYENVRRKYEKIKSKRDLKKKIGFTAGDLNRNCLSAYKSSKLWYDNLIEWVDKYKSFKKSINQKYRELYKRYKNKNRVQLIDDKTINSSVQNFSKEYNVFLKNFMKTNRSASATYVKCKFLRKKFDITQNKFYKKYGIKFDLKSSKSFQIYQDRISPTIEKYNKTILRLLKRKKVLSSKAVKNPILRQEIERLETSINSLQVKKNNLIKAKNPPKKSNKKILLNKDVYKVIVRFFRYSLLLLKFAEFERKYVRKSPKFDELIVPDRITCNKMNSLARKFYKLGDKTTRVRTRDGLKILEPKEREYILNLFTFFKNNVNLAVKKIWNYGISDFRSLNDVNSTLKSRNKLVEKFYGLFVNNSNKFNIDAIEKYKSKLNIGTKFNKKFIPGSLGADIVRAIMETASHIVASNIDYIASLIVVTKYFNFLIQEQDDVEDVEALEDEEDELVGEKSEREFYNFLEVLTASPKKDEIIVREIKPYIAKNRVEGQKGTVDSRLLKFAVRKFKTYLKREYDLEKAKTESIERSKIIKFFKELIKEKKDISNLCELLNIPVMKENIYVSAAGGEPINFKLSVIPTSDVEIGSSGVRERDIKVGYTIHCPKVKKTQENSDWTRLNLVREFKLKESKRHFQLKDNYSDIINTIFQLKTGETLTQINKNLSQYKPYPHQFKLYRDTVFSEKELNFSENDWRRNYIDSLYDHLKQIKKNKSVDFTDITLQNFLRVEYAPELSFFINFLIDFIKKNYSFIFNFLSFNEFESLLKPTLKKGSKKSKKQKTPSFKSIMFKIIKIHDKIKDNTQFTSHSNYESFKNFLEFLKSFQYYFSHYVKNETLRPAKLRLTPSGNLEIISAWSVDQHQQKEIFSEQSIPIENDFTLGVDLGVTELITLDIRNNDMRLKESDKNKYIFSDSDKDKLKKSVAKINTSNKELNEQLERLRELYYKKGGIKDLIDEKISNIRHLWEIYNESNKKYGTLLSKEDLKPFNISLIRKYHLETIALTDKIKNSQLELAHLASGFLRYISTLLNVKEIHMEFLSDYEVLGKGNKFLNRELSNWIRGLINSLLKYKTESIIMGVKCVSSPAHYTSKSCHICKNIGNRGTLLENGILIKKGYGTAFKCSNPFCLNFDKVMHADLIGSRNISQ